jgi:hypothetical protein
VHARIGAEPTWVLPVLGKGAVRFRRSRHSAAAVPGWASPLTANELAEFQTTVLDELRPYGVTLGDGFVTGRRTRHGLSDLAQLWAMSEPSERPGLVRGHFSQLLAAGDAPGPDGEDVIPLLRPRVWSQETVDRTPVPLITRGVADDLVAVLCVDLPTTVVNLRPEQAEATGRSIDELWEVALAQIDDGQETTEQDLANGTRAVIGDSLFIASRVLALDRFAGPLPDDGALLAVPHRHMLLVHEIRSLEVIQGLDHLVGTAADLFRQGPGSVSPSVYWWRPNGRLVRVTASVDQAGVTVRPPDDLVEVLNRLPPAGDT